MSECKEKGKLRGNPGFPIVLSPRGPAPTTSHCPCLPLPSPRQHFTPFIPVRAHRVLIHSSGHAHLGCFPSLAVRRNTVLHAHTFILGRVPRCGTGVTPTSSASVWDHLRVRATPVLSRLTAAGGGLCLVCTSWVTSDTRHLLMACWLNPPGGEPPPCWAGVGGGVQVLKHSWPLSGFS